MSHVDKPGSLGELQPLDPAAARTLTVRFWHHCSRLKKGIFAMTVTHVGSTKKYSSGWETIFSGKKQAKKPAASKAAGKKKASPRKKAKR
ncbi:MAG TPA: hypothetical protein VG826_30915 [Pirellulales bacterium]|nr:hypothetical protein [Pirellulales bacterium]